MADAAALEQLTAALRKADLDGYQRGLAQARAELAGQDPAGLIAGAFADAMESTASRMVQVDADFADRLRLFAGKLRSMNTLPEVVAYDPRSGAVVPAEADLVQATFDQDMDAASVSLEVRAQAGGQALKGKVSYDQASRTVSLRLAHGLTAGVAYRATTDGKTRDGVGLTDAFSWEFEAAE